MSGKIAVVYKTKYGSTKKYAGWIAGELKSDLIDRRKISIGDLAVYDTIVYGGSLHAGGISGYDIISKNLKKLDGKRIAVFSVGAAPINEKNMSMS